MQTRVKYNGQHLQSPLDTPGVNPAFTIRRHLLQAKEEIIQIEQMKKVNRKIRFYFHFFFLFILDNRRTC
jgi:hypothetical protein